MKIVTILGTRPEIIRLSLIIKRLDALCNHVLVDTNQNYEFTLSRLFFDELDVRKPNYSLGTKGNFGTQVGQILKGVEEILSKEKPDALLVLGDTNSGLSAIVAKRMGIRVFHMEAGNRCFDDRVPEEVNRRIIDHASTILLPYTRRSKENLIREGISIDRIYVTGNPIWEVIQKNSDSIEKSAAQEKYRVQKGKFFLATMHRAENVDNETRLSSLLSALKNLCKEYSMPMLLSLHPRTRDRMAGFNLNFKPDPITYLEPLSFFDFVALEKEAFCVLSDSGTVQEECCILKRPNVTIRDVTERPETIECGSNILSGVEPAKITQSVKIVTSTAPQWDPPGEYLKENVAETVVKIAMGYYEYTMRSL